MSEEKTYYQDAWNTDKIWEVSKRNGAYILRQYIKGQPFGKEVRTTEKFLRRIGIFDFREIANGRLVLERQRAQG